jgi:hypothetical protein
MTTNTTPNTLEPGSLALVTRAVQQRTRACRTSADAAQRGIVATSRHIDSAEYLTEQATLFTQLAAKLESAPAWFTLPEMQACREAVELQRRRAARRPGGEQAMYWRLGDKLAQMASFLEPRPWPVAGVVHFDISTEADGMHLPRCGQVDNRGLGPARTGYSTDPGAVTCKKCAAAIAKASAVVATG